MVLETAAGLNVESIGAALAGRDFQMVLAAAGTDVRVHHPCRWGRSPVDRHGRAGGQRRHAGGGAVSVRTQHRDRRRLAGHLRLSATHGPGAGRRAVADPPPAKRRTEHDAAKGAVGGNQGARRAMARGGRGRASRQRAAGRDRARWSPRRRVTVVNARFPWVLFLPLASITEAGGVLLLLSGRGIGWAAVLAPAIGFLAM